MIISILIALVFIFGIIGIISVLLQITAEECNKESKRYKLYERGIYERVAFISGCISIVILVAVFIYLVCFY